MGAYPQNRNRDSHLYRRCHRDNLLRGMNRQKTEAYLPRQIKLIVIHCSATRCNACFTAEQLEQCHRARGLGGTGYHFYITRQGRTHTTRPPEKAGAHARSFNLHSIGICYEGGLNEQGTPADTRTEVQKDALWDLLLVLKRRYPQARIAGHRELSADIGKACPCFDVGREYQELSSEGGNEK